MSRKNNTSTGPTRTLTPQRHITASIQTGPVPPADEIGRYYAIDPSLVDRIFSMAEKEQEMRKLMMEKEVDLQAKAIDSNNRANEIVLEQQRLKVKDSSGLRLFVFLVVALLVVGTLTAYVLTKDVTFVYFFLVELVALASFLFRGISIREKVQRNNSENKKS